MNSIKSEVIEVKRKKTKSIFKISLSIALIAFVFDMSTESSVQMVKPVMAAGLTSVSVVPASGLKNQRTTYDIFLRTATTGTIKTIEIAFPSTFDLTVATKLIEKEGIGSGSLSSSGSTLKYTVTNPVSIAAGTTIRLEIARIVAINAGSFTASIRTLNTANSQIDGPTNSASFVIRSVFGQDVSTSFMIRKTLLDDTAGQAKGWNPDAISSGFTITDSDFSGSKDTAFVDIIVTDGSAPRCEVLDIFPENNLFTIHCEFPPIDFAKLQYVITKLPAHVISGTVSSSFSSSQYESLRSLDQIASEFP